MKRIGTLIAAACLLLLLLTACAQQTATESTASVSFDPGQVKTMADVFPFKETGDFQDATTETQYIFAFEADGVYYRAEADMPEGLFDEVMSIEYDEEHDAAVEKLLAPLKVTSLTNLSEQIPPQEELDKLVGKTGQELFDDGWTYWFYDLDEMKAGLNSGLFAYEVFFDYDGEPMENTDDFDFYEEFKDLKVKSVTFTGLGDAANPDTE